jgi:hypothetical protein
VGDQSTDIRAYWGPYKVRIITISIGEGITSIAPNAFENYTALETIFLPATLSNVGSTALSGLVSLADIYFEGATRPTGIGSNMGNLQMCAVHIPEGSGASYDVSPFNNEASYTLTYDMPLTGTVTIDGNYQAGQQLTANTTGLAHDSASPTYSYQWKIDDVDIGGATSKTYTPATVDPDAVLSVHVSEKYYVGSVRGVKKLPCSILTAEQVGGTNGKTLTTDIKVTFDRNVTQPPEDAFTIISPDGRTKKTDTVTDAGDDDDKTWTIGVKPGSSGTWNNGTSTVQVAVASFGDYESDGSPANVPVLYAPVPIVIPSTVAVDHVNQTLTGLNPNREFYFRYTYGFSAVLGTFGTDAFGNTTWKIPEAVMADPSAYNLQIQAIALDAEPLVNSEWETISFGEPPDDGTDNGNTGENGGNDNGNTGENDGTDNGNTGENDGTDNGSIDENDDENTDENDDEADTPAGSGDGTPQTGDEYNQALWISLMCVSGLGIAIATIWRRKGQLKRPLHTIFKKLFSF